MGRRARTECAAFMAAMALAVQLITGSAATTGAGETTEEPVSAGATRVIVPGLAAQRPSVDSHVVESGETLATLATLYATTGELLRGLNPGLDEPVPGIEVLVPSPAPAPAELPCGDLLAPVDKAHALPKDCRPPELKVLPPEVSYLPDQRLEPRAAAALMAMLEAARAAGHKVVVRSSFRSYDEQVVTFQYWVEQLGRERALQVSAMPGHSEHQLGTTVDVTSPAVDYELTEAFGDTPPGRWLDEHSWQYGFVVSYPEGESEITGYDYEPWHLRWVGEEAAAGVESSGLTLHTWLLGEWRPGRYLLPNP